jgi:hypothetical protein
MTINRLFNPSYTRTSTSTRFISDVSAYFRRHCFAFAFLWHIIFRRRLLQFISTLSCVRAAFTFHQSFFCLKMRTFVLVICDFSPEQYNPSISHAKRRNSTTQACILLVSFVGAKNDSDTDTRTLAAFLHSATCGLDMPLLALIPTRNVSPISFPSQDACGRQFRRRHLSKSARQLFQRNATATATDSRGGRGRTQHRALRIVCLPARGTCARTAAVRDHRFQHLSVGLCVGCVSSKNNQADIE